MHRLPASEGGGLAARDGVPGRGSAARRIACIYLIPLGLRRLYRIGAGWARVVPVQGLPAVASLRFLLGLLGLAYHVPRGPA